MHMRSLGFLDAVVTAAGPDGGVDVVATGALAQVKHFNATPVGAPAVRQLRGAAHAGEWAIFYAASGYSTSAIAFASDATVALFSYDARGLVTPVNTHAASLVHASSSPSGHGYGAAAADYQRAEETVETALNDALDNVAKVMAATSRATREGRLRGRAGRRAIDELESIVKSLSTVTTTSRPAKKHMATISEAERRLRALARKVR
jgi:hypothetical protein